MLFCDSFFTTVVSTPPRLISPEIVPLFPSVKKTPTSVKRVLTPCVGQSSWPCYFIYWVSKWGYLSKFGTGFVVGDIQEMVRTQKLIVRVVCF
jgi:hypothetical protein